MSVFINPYTDYGFKKLFGEEKNKQLLISFLNDLLGGEEQITPLTQLTMSEVATIRSALKADS